MAQAPPNTDPGRARRVLLVESDPDVRSIATAILALEAFEVIESATCRESLLAVLRERPDVILTGLRFPDGDGIEYLGQLHRVAPEVPVVILSGDGRVCDPAFVKAARALGVVEVYAKPTLFTRLVASLREALRMTGASAPEARHRTRDGDLRRD
jgi:DNA-binding NtrC family response regulator